MTAITTRTDPPAAPRVLSGWALVAALVVLIGFAVFVVVMIVSTDVREPTWTRLAWVFASVEAIAFGAAGALFGSTIQRQRAEAAEDRAVRNERDANNGRSLATQLKAEAAVPTPGLEAATPVAARYAELARLYFPD